MIQKKGFSIVLILLICGSCIAQIQSKQEAIESMEWVINNPQFDDNKPIETRLAEILKWKARRYPDTPMRVGGISEIQNELRGSKLYKTMISIYICSTFIHENYTATESAVYSINNVLTYYKNAVRIDGNLKHELLEEYLNYSESELERKMRKLTSE